MIQRYDFKFTYNHPKKVYITTIITLCIQSMGTEAHQNSRIFLQNSNDEFFFALVHVLSRISSLYSTYTRGLNLLSYQLFAHESLEVFKCILHIVKTYLLH